MGVAVTQVETEGQSWVLLTEMLAQTEVALLGPGSEGRGRSAAECHGGFASSLRSGSFLVKHKPFLLATDLRLGRSAFLSLRDARARTDARVW
ncbi:hypothetical protein PC123_g21066 [Phytophthora cactorum]|nr:hypothetical protein PC123_g21066 [Phytophthora cactorum]